MLIYVFFSSVDVLAFATWWSIKPVPGLNNVAVEGVQSGSSQKQETQQISTSRLFPLFSIRYGLLNPRGFSGRRGLSVYYREELHSNVTYGNNAPAVIYV